MSLALAAGGIALAPVAAKKAEEARPLQMTPEVQKLLVEAQAAQEKKDYATLQAKITAAEALAKTEDDHFQLGILTFNLGNGTNNPKLQAQGADEAIASNRATPEQLKQLLNVQGVAAYNAGDLAKAEAAFARLVQLDPNDGDSTITLAQIKQRNHKPAEAITLINQAIAAKKASGQPVPQEWYQRALGAAYEAKLPGAVDMAVSLVSNFPTADNWRDALTVYRDTYKLDPVASLDVMRLIRAAHALKGERDYYEYASTALGKGLPGEAKAVMDEGSQAGAITVANFKDMQSLSGTKISMDKASLPGLEKQARSAKDGKLAANTGDAYLGYKEYAQAAGLYRDALQKGGVDVPTVATHLGIALALSGDKAGAQQAFAQVTGPRAMLAKFWTIWLGQKA
jgi:tetratricopeptide (TPR) repeat protein